MAKHYNNYNSNRSRTLEVTVLSCEDLRISKRPISKNAFVTVRSGSGETRSTSMDADGGSYPRRDERFAVEVPVNAPTALTVEVRCKTAFGEKIVGTASVPAADFSGGYVPESYLHFLSYRLRDSKGQRNGIVNLSVRTKSHHHQYTCSAEERSSSSGGAAAAATVGVPVGNNNNYNNAGVAVVTGVPVLCSYQRGY